MISGQKPIKKSKQGQFQIVDVVEMMRPLTKTSKQIVNGGIPFTMDDMTQEKMIVIKSPAL